MAQPVDTTSTEYEHEQAAAGQDPPAGVDGRAEPTWVVMPSDDVTNAPTTATPSVAPTWREVEAMADATPACALGMPETAAFVIGALTNPKPIPKTT